jgi:hypothetical protein
LPPAPTAAEAAFVLPPELRNRITRFQIEGARGAGSVSLADDSLRRRKVALLNVREGTEAWRCSRRCTTCARRWSPRPI